MNPYNAPPSDGMEREQYDDLSWASYRRQVLEALKEQSGKINILSSRIDNVTHEVQLILSLAGKVDTLCQGMSKLSDKFEEVTIQLAKVESRGSISWAIIAAVGVAAVTAFLGAIIPHILFK